MKTQKSRAVRLSLALVWLLFTDIGFAAVFDTDGDGIQDQNDNCVTIQNPNQVDADADGYGNLCDADFDNSGYVNIVDYGIFGTSFFTADPVVDLNSDGFVNIIDYGILSIIME